MPEAGSQRAGSLPRRDTRTHTHKHTPLQPRASWRPDTPAAAASPGTGASQPVSPGTEKSAAVPGTGRRARRRPPAPPPRLPPRGARRNPPAGAALRQPYRGQQRLHLRPLVLSLHAAAAGLRRRPLPAARGPGRSPGAAGAAGLRRARGSLRAPGSALPPRSRRGSGGAEAGSARQSHGRAHRRPREGGHEPEPPAGCGMGDEE